ncbi:MAG: NAD(P)-dependent alcohol dehydrogenase [Bacteroidetes bacterium HGW-Bacteroidetes-17]|jgi:NADPH:quinone reductase-like Zn-dependent oxidoreductase|nr:MAG: NAD(P)-dependent alcohol dehydrogenase [Bacteroidetes bacterium HGW-Bacteroidetes-17]
MRAIICPKYGPPEVLQLKEVEKPTPKDDEVLIKIFATAVTASDIFIRSFQIPIRFRIPARIMLGLTKPKKSIIGLVLAGEIESVGKNVTRFKSGDQVYGLTGYGFGAYAEYKCMKVTDSIHGCLGLKPTNLTYEEATVAAYGGLLAFQFMEKANIQPGQNVLIYGASGTTGTIAIQYAKYLGAKVTGVCSGSNMVLVKSLGADTLIDYTKEDTLQPGIQYDFILDAVGKMKTSKLKEACKKALAPGGKYVSIDDANLLLDSKRLALIKELIEARHIRPVIDRCYPLEEIVAAHSYVEKGHKRGGVVITVV